MQVPTPDQIIVYTWEEPKVLFSAAYLVLVALYFLWARTAFKK